MITKKTLFSIVYIYISAILIVTILVIINQGKKYNHLYVINDREEVIAKSENRTPIKLEFYSKVWGEGVIEDNKIIQNIWNVISEIPKSGEINSYNQSIYDSDYNEITGTILYLNGIKSNFSLSNTLKIDDYNYGDYYSKPYLNKLRSDLEEIVCSPQNLSGLINERNKVTIVNNANDITKKCGEHDKNGLRRRIAEFTSIHDTKELQEAIKNKGKVEYHIKIYVDLEEGYNIINIDVYENDYIVVQDFGKEITKAMYMKGHILDVCRIINNNKM
ncbi:DUF3919 family protein [Clostridium aestuarii]|uniref:DUF3919 family protein n=1 Tax=Clostridium aestuarii TaxID=338193 RepID=A0ABT4D3L8_9CLOT|nr:DUF3919 family protein [Clostridium aestuarii]MCY6485833.1 DUF3919 family protein [Clostridium aestuarii]